MSSLIRLSTGFAAWLRTRTPSNGQDLRVRPFTTIEQIRQEATSSAALMVDTVYSLSKDFLAADFSSADFST